ncbi:hypothetical protein ACYATP_08350 [Lactobacillaceae bacterium Melli_B4]
MDFKTLKLDQIDMTATNRVMKNAWPSFMVPDHDVMQDWNAVRKTFGSYQIYMLDVDRVIAVANSVPIN